MSTPQEYSAAFIHPHPLTGTPSSPYRSGSSLRIIFSHTRAMAAPLRDES